MRIDDPESIAFWQETERFIGLINGIGTRSQIGRLQHMLKNFPQPSPGGKSPEDFRRHVMRRALEVWLGSLPQPPEDKRPLAVTVTA